VGTRVQKITPFLWFDDRAEEAVGFYTSVFRDAKILGLTRYGRAGAAASGRPEGSVMTVVFQLEGQEFVALNGGPTFAFSPAVSFVVSCESQAEIDELWGKLTDGGQAEECGWLRDKFGVSWRIVPRALGELLQDADPRRAERVMAALLTMRKIDVGALEEARGR